MALTLRKAFHPAERTRSEALLYVMDHSRAGAVIQMFVMDALDKHYQPNAAAQHRPGETNAEVLQRLVDADRLLGREMAFESVLTQARGVVKAGAAALTQSFDAAGTSNLINPLAWLRAAEDAKAALEAAQPDPAPAPKLQDWEQAQIGVVVKNGRYGEPHLIESFPEADARIQLGAALDRLLKGKPGRALTVELTLESLAETAEGHDDED